MPQRIARTESRTATCPPDACSAGLFRPVAERPRVYCDPMSARTWLKRTLSPKTVDTLQSVRHVSAQMLAGADLWQLRIDLERHIEARLSETEAVQDARIMALIREELTRELDRWSQDMMDRMDILLGASNRIVAALEARVAELERRNPAKAAEAPNGHSDATAIAAAREPARS